MIKIQTRDRKIQKRHEVVFAQKLRRYICCILVQGQQCIGIWQTNFYMYRTCTSTKTVCAFAKKKKLFRTSKKGTNHHHHNIWMCWRGSRCSDATIITVLYYYFFSTFCHTDTWYRRLTRGMSFLLTGMIIERTYIR